MKLSKLILFGVLLGFTVSQLACTPPWKKKDIDEPEDLVKILPAAPDDENLGILVSYVSTDNFLNRKLPRLAVITEEEFDTTEGYTFLGRTYSNKFPGRRGFGLPVHEFFVEEFTPDFGIDQSGNTFMGWGFKHVMGLECGSVQFFGVQCPANGNDISEEPVFFSYTAENLAAGIVTLYEYETVGSVGSGLPGSGTVAYTTDVQLLMTMQMIYQGRVKITPIGFIFHSTEEDRKLRLQ